MSAAVRTAALVLGVATGCSLSQPMPVTRAHVLRIEDAPPRGAGRGGVLRVDRIRVARAFERQQFVYRVDDHRYESDFYNRFQAPAGTALREAIIAWFQASGLFAEVLDGPAQVAADWLLEGEATELYADVRRPDAPEAVLTLDLSLTDPRSPTLAQAYRGSYTERVAAASTDPEALRRAWGEALGRILRRFVAEARPVVERRA